jgi:DNA-binding SARP family transcriptional activator
VLGPLEVTRDGDRVEPTSPKQRALLIDLLIHRGETVGRDRLIDDLWGDDPPSTAPGVLQNYVSQLRRALGATTVRTAGTGYALDSSIAVDVDEMEANLTLARSARDTGDAEAVRTAAGDALALWRGDALADVCFEQFAQAEIRRLTELRAMAVELHLESEIAAGRHDSAVALLEAAVAASPLRERLWWLLMLSLYRSGRQADALRAYQRARSILGEELGIDPGEELRELEQAILEQRVDVDDFVGGRTQRPVPRQVRVPTTMLGREVEWSVIEDALEHAEGVDTGLLLLTGEAGIGKTRLLEETALHVAANAGTVITGRAFDAERGRPFGPWIDGLRGAPLTDIAEPVRAGLAPLLPELANERVEINDPNLLYDGVVQALAAFAEKGPVAVLLDDIQWLDEPSAALLHFTVRHLAGSDVRFVATARPAELDDNEACRRVIEALRRDEALAILPIGPLAPATIAELTGPIAPDADASRIAEATNGNPLFAVEMAKALARGEEPLSSRVDGLIGDRLARLDERALALVPWVAAFGRAVPAGVVAAVADAEPADLFGALGELERHGVVRAEASGEIDFVHDLVRAAAYTRVSTARRVMLHARIATVLAAQADPDDSLAADVVRHADAAADSATCAPACARAARRCVRLLAYGDAAALVMLGRSHAQRLDPTTRVHVEIELMYILLHPGISLRDPDLGRDVGELCAEAQRLGLDAELSMGLYLLARVYHWGWGDIPRARALMERAVDVIERSHGPNLEPLLEGARCLAYLEINMPRTAQLFDELGALHVLAEHSVQYQWGVGLVELWRGNTDVARAALAEAIVLATASTDHWITFECTARLALVELEEGAPERAVELCGQLAPLAEKLGEGSEQPYAAAVAAVSEIAFGIAEGEEHLDEAIVAFERIDSLFLVPDVLGIAAECLYRRGKVDSAYDRASSALGIADDVGRPFESARAHALLACIAATEGDAATARSHLDALNAVPGVLPGHVEGLRQQAERLTAALGVDPGGARWP